MTIGAAYIAYSGIEHLQASINCIRSYVNKVVVVFQDVSNFGHRKDTAKDLQGIKGVDVFIKFRPNLSKSAHENERRARQLGLDALKCEYVMTIDCDELYLPDQFKAACKEVISGGYDGSACQMQTYYKDAATVITPPETYYVPFLHKYGQLKNCKYPVTADPTRVMPVRKFKAFDRSQLEMHHLSYVRRDLKEKLINSSARANYSNRINDIIRHYNNFNGGKAYLAGRGVRLCDTKKTTVLQGLL